jgi:ABC-type spermidine/putrescine transport system permease subunit II
MKPSVAYLALIWAISAFLVAPILVVLVASFDGSGQFRLLSHQPSLRWYVAFFESTQFVSAFLLSTMVAVLAALLACATGTLVAIGLVRLVPKAGGSLEIFFLSPIVVPGVLLGAALLLFMLHSPIRGTVLALLIGHLVIAIPYAVQTTVAGLSGIGTTLEEAAMSLGATPFQAFRKTTLPLIRSSIVSAAVFGFVISFSDVNLAIFLSGPNTVTLPMVIFTDVLQTGEPTVAAASALQITLIIVVLLIAHRSLRLRIGQR